MSKKIKKIQEQVIKESKPKNKRQTILSIRRSLTNKKLSFRTQNQKAFHELINENDVNVLVRYQNNFSNDKKWLSAFNTFSKNYWKKNLHLNKKIKFISFKKFNLPFKLKKNKNNPMKTWSLKLKNKNQITVGTGQLLNYYIIHIKLK